jgi:YbgC/YbaW family acyl-CoA thioester hydrolase
VVYLIEIKFRPINQKDLPMADALIHSYPLRILEQHLDSFGHVNNAAYIVMFEQARWEFVTASGCGLDFVRKSGVGPIVLEIQTRFVKEIRLRQMITIKTQVKNWRGKMGVVRQWMEGDDGAVYCDGQFTMGMFDIQARKLIDIDSVWKRALGISAEA